MEKDIFTTKEACEFTGLTKPGIYKLTSTGMLPFSKPGGKMMYFKKSDLEKWMLSKYK